MRPYIISCSLEFYSFCQVNRQTAAHSRQSAKLFLQSLELGPPPTPHPPVGECVPVPPFGSGGRGTLAGEGGGGRVPIPTRGVSNLRWRTFRYWAIRATDMHGMGSSPRREKVNICTDFYLSKETSHITNINKLLPFIYITSPAPPATY